MKIGSNKQPYSKLKVSDNTPGTTSQNEPVRSFKRKSSKKVFESISSFVKHIFKPKSALTNFHVVDEEKLLRGAAPRGDGIQELKNEHNVTTIIDLRSPSNYAQAIEDEKTAVTAEGMHYHNISMLAEKPPTNEQIREFFNIIDNSPGKVYVHCREGKDRTGIMCALYQIEKQNLEPKLAYEEMIKYGHDLVHQLRYTAQSNFLSKYQPGSYKKTDTNRSNLDLFA